MKKHLLPYFLFISFIVCICGHAFSQEDGLYSGTRQALEYESWFTPEQKTMYDRAFILMQQSHWGESIEIFNDLIQATANNPLVYDQMSLAMEKSGRISEAIEANLQALEIDSDYRHAHLNLGFMYNELGQEDRSDYHFEKYLELSPDTPYEVQVMEAMKP